MGVFQAFQTQSIQTGLRLSSDPPSTSTITLSPNFKCYLVAFDSTPSFRLWLRRLSLPHSHPPGQVSVKLCSTLHVQTLLPFPALSRPVVLVWGLSLPFNRIADWCLELLSLNFIPRSTDQLFHVLTSLNLESNRNAGTSSTGGSHHLLLECLESSEHTDKPLLPIFVHL